jgi:hypothetical protein
MTGVHPRDAHHVIIRWYCGTKKKLMQAFHCLGYQAMNRGATVSNCSTYCTTATTTGTVQYVAQDCASDRWSWFRMWQTKQGQLCGCHSHQPHILLLLLVLILRDQLQGQYHATEPVTRCTGGKSKCMIGRLLWQVLTKIAYWTLE